MNLGINTNQGLPQNGGIGMGPGTAYAAGAGLNALGNLFGGQQGSQAQGNLHLVNPVQQALYNQAAQGFMRGDGDFGYGSNYKKGKSQVQDFLASSGVKLSADNPAYAAAMGNMTGQAMGMDADARRQYGLQLMGTPLQIAQTAGANFIPGTVSQGPGTQQQQDNLSRFASTGWVPRGVGMDNPIQSEWGGPGRPQVEPPTIQGQLEGIEGGAGDWLRRRFG